jgi:transcriptional regulator with XRE-family HTH domain
MSSFSGEDIRRWRLNANLSQTDLAEQLGVSQGLVSAWETGRTQPAESEVNKLQGMIRRLARTPSGNSFGDWVRRTREQRNLTVAQLASRAELSHVTIYKIESGDIENPRESTRNRISRALEANIPVDVAQEVQASSRVDGLGESTDFNPHDEEEFPADPGIYVLYDRARRPVYIGQGKSIAGRLKDHKTRFWYKEPIVSHGSYIIVAEDKTRRQIEALMINLLNKHAILNTHHTGSDSED